MMAWLVRMLRRNVSSETVYVINDEALGDIRKREFEVIVKQTSIGLHSQNENRATLCSIVRPYRSLDRVFSSLLFSLIAAYDNLDPFKKIII